MCIVANKFLQFQAGSGHSDVHTIRKYSKSARTFTQLNFRLGEHLGCSELNTCQGVQILAHEIPTSIPSSPPTYQSFWSWVQFLAKRLAYFRPCDLNHVSLITLI